MCIKYYYYYYLSKSYPHFIQFCLTVFTFSAIKRELIMTRSKASPF